MFSCLSVAVQHVFCIHGMPLTSASRCDPASVERLSNLPERGSASLLGFSDDREGICRVLVTYGLVPEVLSHRLADETIYTGILRHQLRTIP